MKMKSYSAPKKLFLMFLGTVCATVVAISAANLLSMSSKYREAETAYEDLAQFVILAESTNTSDAEEPPEAGADHDPAPDPDRQDTDGNKTPPKRPQPPQVDFGGLRAINPDIVGWLYCEGTPINYPVVRGSDNEYYLHHLFNRKHNNAGCLFMDCANKPDFSSQNTIIYGHNLKSGSMLSVLTKYKNQAFYDAHTRMVLMTLEGNYIIELFSGHVAKADDAAWKLSFTNTAAMQAWIDDAYARSDFISNVVVSVNDRFITLSTCTNDSSNARYVVVGRLSPLA